MSAACRQSGDGHRIKQVSLVVGFGLFVAIGLLVAFAAYETSLGNFPVVETDFRGDLKDDELWYGALKNNGNPFFPAYEFQIHRLNLKTGRIADAGLSAFSQKPVPIWVKDTLYVNTYGTFHELSGKSFRTLLPISPMGMTAFDFDGQLTAVVASKKGSNLEFHLTHHVDGKWILGRRILLPDPRQIWRRDPQTNLYQWSTSQSDSARSFGWQASNLFVARQGHDYHLLFRTPDYEFVAYRRGFDFADESSESVSALECENTLRDAHGWEPLSRDMTYWNGNEFSCDRDGPLLLTRKGNKLSRRQSDGRWDDLIVEDQPSWEKLWPTIVARSSESTSYVLLSDSQWSSAKICRIDQGTVHLPDVIVRGDQRRYVERWGSILAALFCIWSVHTLILAMGTTRMTRRAATVPGMIESHRMKLASLRERGIAFLIDAVLLHCLIWIAWLSWRICFFGSSSIGGLPNYDDLTRSLQSLEYMLNFRSQRWPSFLRFFFGSPFGWIFFPLTPDTGFFGAMIAIFVCLGCLYVYFEGRYGITPGKWLIGIRTLGPRLRPCGLGRAIVRNVVRAVDFPLGLTPIPATISLMFSDKRQRLGDRVATTVVVKVESNVD